jgi:hypothetical protein
LWGRTAERCEHLHLVAYGVPLSVCERSSEWSRPGPIPAVRERSRTKLDLVAAV